MAKRRRFLVIGLGRFGRAVAEALVEGGGEVIGVDPDMALVDAVRDRIAIAAQVDSVDPDALREVGVEEIDGAVVAIGEDFAARVLTVALLKELGVAEIVTRADSDRERRILELVGATRVIAVDVESGQRVARSLLATEVVDSVSLAEGVSIIFWTADERVVGRKLADAEIASRSHLHVIGVRTGGTGGIEFLPAPDYVVREGDVLLLAGADARLAAFTR